MANVKTAISLRRALFEQADELAREMNTSRSHILALALEEFIRRHRNRQLLERINAAVEETADQTEARLRRRMRHHQRRIVEGQW